MLPVYNGEKYLVEQLDSIVNQTYKNWHLYIRDDGSKDGSVQIMEEYEEKYENITIIKDDIGNLGVTKNVFELLKHSTGDYIMLSDQDDVWFQDKIEYMLKLIRHKEKAQLKCPVLICSNAVVTDEKLNELHESFYQCAYYDKRRIYFSNLLQRNIIQGAASIFNRELLTLLKPILDKKVNKTILHDHWIALVASAFGTVYMSGKKLMYYRQHERNLVGALRFRTSVDIESIWKIYKNSQYRKLDSGVCKEFYGMYSNQLGKRQLDILNMYRKREDSRRLFVELALYKEYTLVQSGLKLLFGVCEY